jgi:hypothetical protein
MQWQLDQIILDCPSAILEELDRWEVSITRKRTASSEPEQGNPNDQLPDRPFMRSTIKEAAKTIRSQMKKAAKAWSV